MRFIFRFFLYFLIICKGGFAYANSCSLDYAAELNINSFAACNQKQLDSFYKKLSLGNELPRGAYEGKVELSAVSAFNFYGIKEYVLERLWKGKVFYPTDSRRAILFNKILDENQRRELFPAHVYFGESLFDTRPAIIIDYSKNQNIDGYREAIDWVVNEKGLAIRDEIRKVRPGLYLGRAYSKSRFLLNFVLEEE